MTVGPDPQREGGPGPRIVAYVPDLMDRSKVTAAAPGPVRFVGSPVDLVAAATDQAPPASAVLAVVDLGRPGVQDVLEELAALVEVVAFGPHVDSATLDAARRTGCEVVARSAFFGDLSAYLT
jgi:hypothetical protein